MRSSIQVTISWKSSLTKWVYYKIKDKVCYRLPRKIIPTNIEIWDYVEIDPSGRISRILAPVNIYIAELVSFALGDDWRISELNFKDTSSHALPEYQFTSGYLNLPHGNDRDPELVNDFCLTRVSLAYPRGYSLCPIEPWPSRKTTELK